VVAIRSGESFGGKRDGEAREILDWNPKMSEIGSDERRKRGKLFESSARTLSLDLTCTKARFKF